MSIYFDSPDKLESLGRKLPTPPDINRMIKLQLAKPAFKSLCSQLKEGELLFGLYDLGPRRVAVQIPNSLRLRGFEISYQRGDYVHREFFGVAKATAEEHGIYVEARAI